MTHDELLAKIDEIISKHIGVPSMYKALRAVVELHKPKIDISGLPLMGKFPTKCEICKKFYPCPTIQAIEKELE